MLYHLATVFLLVLEVRAAQVQLGATSIIGMDLPLLGQEFFGGIESVLFFGKLIHIGLLPQESHSLKLRD